MVLYGKDGSGAVRRLDSDIVGEFADEETAMKAELEFVGANGVIHSLSRIIRSTSQRRRPRCVYMPAYTYIYIKKYIYIYICVYRT